MVADGRAANAMGGKTARACDGCLRKRARWFCVADDAFLCQACDASVHSANQLASRHERVRLETASSSKTSTEDSSPAWHQGITRKARTPRHNMNNKYLLVQNVLKNNKEKVLNPLPFVPEVGSEEEGNTITDENEELLYRVPVFDPFPAELCDIITSEETEREIENEEGSMGVDVHGHEGTCDLDNLLPSDMDLAEFAADVESLLGRGFDEESPDIKDLGLLDYKEEVDGKLSLFGAEKVVKVKEEEGVEEIIPGFQFDQSFEMARESSEWNFDCKSPVDGDEEVEEKAVPVAKTAMAHTGYKEEMKRNISLRLNYEAVMNAWASQRSPWATGSRPDLNPNDCWPDCMGACPKDIHHPYGGLGHKGGGNGGREARVMRYKEKRRTRLFAKKIRYEVRKLNAEKRPRMKGRFVKRSSFLGTAFPNYLNK